MTSLSDQSDTLTEHVVSHAETRAPLAIVGSGSKRALGPVSTGTPLDVTGHRGIVTFEPTELVLTARAGTPLAEIETTLAQAQQMMPFEPPQFAGGGTIGGAIACGLSGPRRPFAGSARDFVLGTRVISGRGEVLRFGGEVMKNVAGYDVSRLMTGAYGTLGVVLDVSLKVLPLPASETTCCLQMHAREALEWMDETLTQAYPISALAHLDDMLFVRLSGSQQGVRAAAQEIGGERIADDTWWRRLRDHDLTFFQNAAPLWRIAVPAGTPMLELDGPTLLDWGGTQRWIASHADAATVRAAAVAHGGHAMRFDGAPEATFQPLDPALVKLHQRLKDAFDPFRILNRARLYPDL
jgi:glycolate oxidase FAD binding subunit